MVAPGASPEGPDASLILIVKHDDAQACRARRQLVRVACAKGHRRTGALAGICAWATAARTKMLVVVDAFMFE